MVSDIVRFYNARKHSRERYRPMYIYASQYESFEWLSTIDDHEEEDINVFYLYDDHIGLGQRRTMQFGYYCYNVTDCYYYYYYYYSTNISAILGVCRRDSRPSTLQLPRLYYYCVILPL